ncbi:MAG: hypothetical protein HY329_15590, partial [Chloroflexi bacterium]|nr:hypothetical protein [Chloroflexota bacterium]
IDSAVAAALRAAGAVLLGALNLHEFGFGTTSASSHFGPVRNPWSPEHIPGGSSGGSGAATAAGLAYATMGSDTGGSIRIPAAFCGVFGLKPTYGLVSVRGAVPLAWSLDHAGPLTRTVRDCAIVLNAIAGHDPGYAASADVPIPDYTAALGEDLRGVRIGVPRRYFFERLDPEVERATEAALTTLRSLGAELVEVAYRGARLAGIASTIVLFAEAAALHDDWLRTRRHEYTDEVRGHVVLGKFLLAMDYVNAQRARTLLVRELAGLMQRVDVLVTPQSPVPPTRIDQESVVTGGRAEDIRNAIPRFTRAFNLTGSPAASVPCGFTAAGLPLGLQIVGKPFAEATVLRVCHAYEQATDWHHGRPPASA